MNLSIEELRDIVKKEAKSANQRQVRLEKEYGNKASNVSPAYRMAQLYLGERTRFKENPQKLSYNELEKEYKAINKFKNSKVSTISGVKQAENASIKTFIQNQVLDRRPDIEDRIYNKKGKAREKEWQNVIDEYKNTYDKGELFQNLADFNAFLSDSEKISGSDQMKIVSEILSGESERPRDFRQLDRATTEQVRQRQLEQRAWDVFHGVKYINSATPSKARNARKRR